MAQDTLIGASGNVAQGTRVDKVDARVRRYNQELDRLFDVQSLPTMRLEDFLQDICCTASRMLAIARVGVWVFTEDQAAVNCLNLYSREDDCHVQGEIARGTAPPGYFDALALSRVVEVRDVRADSRTRQFTETYLRPLNIVSALSARVPTAHDLRGVICCESTGDARDWLPDEATFLASLAALIGLAFERADRARISSELEARRQKIEHQSSELAKLALVAQHAEDAVVICDKHRKIEWANPAFLNLSEYSLEEVKGKSPRDIVQGPKTNPKTNQSIAYALDGKKAIRTEILNYSKSGRAYWLELQINPVFDEFGEIERFIAVQREISERIESQARLADAVAAAERASATKSTFLAMMSHEIRTPMNGVLGMAEALSKTDLSADQSRMLGVIRDAGDLLMNVLNDVLDFSRIEAGEFALERSLFPLDEVLRRIESLHSFKAREKGIELDVRGLPRDVAQFRVGDQTRVLQILHNLVHNAIKFTSQGSVVVSCRNWHPGQGKEGLVLEVCDSGIGLNKSQLLHIFDPFFQSDASTNRKFGGSGLGLSIVKGLVDAMNGSIEAENNDAQGATFRILLPLPEANQNTDMQSSSKENSDAQILPSGISVLIAEDNEINRVVLQSMLGPAGAELYFAVDGREAVQAVQSRRFDVILMDIQMPVMDGEEALKEIRRYELENGIGPTPVVAVTANAMVHHVQRYRELGFNGYIAKPVNVAAVYQVILEQISEPERMSA